MAAILDLSSWICLVAGSFFALVSSLAVLRLPDYYSRIHGAGITDTMGAGLILLGLALQAGISLVTAKLALVLIFLVLTGPTASHALAKAAYRLGLDPVLNSEKDKASSSR
ncbi:MAG: monovalent cation/H(+) antiporter subunit G [Acidobacteriota bacterium]